MNLPVSYPERKILSLNEDALPTINRKWYQALRDQITGAESCGSKHIPYIKRKPPFIIKGGLPQ